MSIQLSDYRNQSFEELVEQAYEKGLDNAGQFSPAELIFELVCAEVEAYGEQKVNIVADGLLEILSDGFGFLRVLCPTLQPVQMTCTYLQRRFDGLICRLEIGFKVSPERRKITSATLLCFESKKSTVVHLK